MSDFYTPSYPGHLNHKVIGGTLGIFLGKEKTAEPKLKDKDKDGVADDRDACPPRPALRSQPVALIRMAMALLTKTINVQTKQVC